MITIAGMFLVFISIASSILLFALARHARAVAGTDADASDDRLDQSLSG
jgi:hypothetical protein